MLTWVSAIMLTPEGKRNISKGDFCKLVRLKVLSSFQPTLKIIAIAYTILKRFYFLRPGLVKRVHCPYSGSCPENLSCRLSFAKGHRRSEICVDFCSHYSNKFRDCGKTSLVDAFLKQHEQKERSVVEKVLKFSWLLYPSKVFQNLSCGLCKLQVYFIFILLTCFLLM